MLGFPAVVLMMRRDAMKTMKTNPGLRLRTVGRRHMIVKVDDARVNMTDVFTLNDTAAALWRRAETSGFTEESLAAWLGAEYGIGEDVALADVREILARWAEYGLVSEEEDERG